MNQDPSGKLKDILHIEKKSPLDSMKEELIKKASAKQTEQDSLVTQAWEHYHKIKESKIQEVLQLCEFSYGAFHLKGPVRSLQENEIKIFPRTKGFWGFFQKTFILPYETKEEIMADFQKELNSQNIQVRAIVAYRFNGKCL